MPGEIPYFIEGTVVQISNTEKTAYVRVPNGNVYYVHPFTPKLKFNDLSVGKRVMCEVTSVLTKVLSARVID